MHVMLSVKLWKLLLFSKFPTFATTKYIRTTLDSKKRILISAGDLFRKYGVRSVSMDDIARHLSISKKTIYRFFKDKDEIVLLATRAHLELEMKEYKEVEQNAQNAIEELVGVNRCMRKDFKNINPSLLFDLEKYHPKSWQEWLNFKYVFIMSYIASNLRRGIEQEYIRSDIDPDIIARMRVEQVEQAFNEKIFPRDRYTVGDIQLMLFEFFIHGILTEKGKLLYEDYLKETDLKGIK
jgi:AcrR family transcriptional regulator